MASLLGGEYCIESLRQDVKDLQEILDDVHSRIGQVKYQSWKFPDKASCDVDISRLLSRCQYNKVDEEESQMSHVMLYDVVIDRLVYLLQSFICFNEILLNVESRGSQTSPSPASRKGKSVKSMSVGLTVKKCWGRITQIASLLQKLAKEVNSKSFTTMRDDKSSPVGGRSTSIKIDALDSEVPPQKDIPDDKDVSRDVRSISCQTHETAYTNCETCCHTQSCLSEVGRSIVDLCKSQNLPTVLEDYQTRYNDSVPMSVADLVRWSKHQSKDLSRISRHMASLVNQVTPLKADLATVKKSEQKIMTELQQSQSVYERKEAELKEEFRRREYRLKEVEKDLKKKLSTMESIRTGMQEEIEKLNWKISDLKDELLQKHRDHLAQENSLSQFKEEAIEGQQYKKDALKFKNDLSRVKSELEETRQLVNRDRQLYERELTKNENMLQHEKILQDKQRNLLSRMETVNEDCEQMREQILTLEEERDAALMKLAEEKNKQAPQSGTQNQALATVQTNEVESLRQSIEALRLQNKDLISTVDEYVERERLLVAYPDLNQPSTPSPMVNGSGDVVTDMKKQVETNEIRMQILEKENEALLKTLEKMNVSNDLKSQIPSSRSTLDTTARSELYSAAMNESVYEPKQPIQLWQTSSIATEQEEENSPEADWYKKHRNSKSPSAFSPKWQSSQTKPPSGRKKNSTILQNKPYRRHDVPDFNGIHVDSGSLGLSSNSLEAYKKIKQQQQFSSGLNLRSSFTVGSGKRPKSGRPSSAKSALFKPWT